MPTFASLTNYFRKLLERMVQARGRYRKGFLARAAQRVRAFGAAPWLLALDRAIGRGLNRKRAALDLLAELTDLPQVAERFNTWLRDPDSEWRAEVIEFIGDKGLRQFAPALNDALSSGKRDLCWAYAVSAAGQLASEANVSAILRLTGDPETNTHPRLIWAFHGFPHPRFRPALKRLFRSLTEKEERVRVAWALAKLGDEKAERYLVEMLDDPDVETPTSFISGVSLRAAQALCDVHGWPFRWDKGWVTKTRKMWLSAGEEKRR
jgi:HEAT repeat protein